MRAALLWCSAALVAAQPAPSMTHLPTFSWDTLPVFTHLSQPTPYTAEQIATLAKFPLITIEKYMGPFPLAAGRAEEDNIADVATAVKRINPEAKVIMYVNSFFAYPWYHLYQTADQNGWWINNVTSGKPYTHAVIQMNCTEEEKVAGKCPSATVPYWQFAEAGLQAAWVAACTDAAVDGCFVDGGCSSPPYGAGGQLQQYFAGRNATFTAIAAKALIVVNDKDYEAPPFPAVQGEFIETFGGSDQVWLDRLRTAAAGHLVQAHTNTICHHPNSTSGLKDLAAFLVGAREYSYFGCSNWEDFPTWPEEYDRPLGAPLGPAAQGVDGTWTRRFASGTNVSINFGTGTASVDWGSA